MNVIVITIYKVVSYLSEESIVESHVTVLSDGGAGLAVEFVLGFLEVGEAAVDQFAVAESLAADADGAGGDENNVVSEGVELLNLLAESA